MKFLDCDVKFLICVKCCIIFRQVALKALNDRLAKVESPSWPSMEDGAESGSLVTSNVKFNENTSAVSVNIGVDDHQLPSASVPVLQTDSS